MVAVLTQRPFHKLQRVWGTRYNLLIIQGPALDVCVAGFGKLIQSGLYIQILGSFECTGVTTWVSFNFNNSINSGQSTSHGSSTATSSHTWKFQ